MIRTWMIVACVIFMGSLLMAQNIPVLTELKTFKEKGDAIEEHGFFLSGAFSPDGKMVAVSTDRGFLMLWDLESGKKLKEKKLTKSIHLSLKGLAFSPDSKKLLYCKASKDVGVWNIELEQEAQVFQFPHELAHICVTNDGKFLISAGRGEYTTESKVVIWNMETGDQVRSFVSKKIIHNIAISPDGTKLACATEKGIPLFDMSNAEELDRFEEKAMIRGAAFSADGKFLAFATMPNNSSSAIHLYDMATKKAVAELTGMPSGIRQIVIAPDGTLLAARVDRYFYVYHIASNKHAKMEMRDVESIGFSMDSKSVLAVGKVDKKPCAVLWKIELK